ncbi:membrane-spanning 4-domains subfamily A member 4A-like isoform 1-T2 [Leptodactylus fuscus]|uniref:membrane-spanning 4-domains subfamily A member 4A-like n=1 Tax=Leptodactylus fuscus TaxID=238119 RepID=UPI003F4F1C1B
MMSKTNEVQNPFAVPPGTALPPQNCMPSQSQWTVVQGPNGANVYPASSPWTIQQVGPQHFPSPPAQQWTGQPVVPGQNVSNGILTPVTGEAAWYQEFMKGRPKALGITLIVAGVFLVVFGIALPFVAAVYSFYSGIVYWGPIFYIIAGSYTKKAQQKQNIGLVKLSYGFSIFCCIVSLLAIIIDILDMAVLRCYHDDYYYCDSALAGAYAVLSLIFILHVLVFCVTVSIAIFGGRSLACEPTNVPQVLVIQNVMPATAAYPGDPAQIPTSPPPYNM